MPAMIVKHRVANFDAWKKMFDSMQESRHEHGWTGHSVYRDVTDPNVVVIVNRMTDIAGAKSYGATPALRDAMQHGGVQGPPEITFLNDGETKTY